MFWDALDLYSTKEINTEANKIFFLMWQGPFSNCSLGERDLNFALGQLINDFY